MSTPNTSTQRGQVLLSPKNVRLAVLACSIVGTTIYLLLSVTKLHLGDLQTPGAGLWPIAIGTLALVLGLATLVSSAIKDTDTEPLELPTGRDAQRWLLFIGLMCAFLLTLGLFGFFVGGALMLVLVMRVLSDVGWRHCLLVSLALSGAFYFLFVFVFAVRFPPGLLATLFVR